MKRTEKKVSITREEMRSIKKMDHQEMEEVLTKAYAMGADDAYRPAFQEGKKSGMAAGEKILLEIIPEVKGIGGARADAIISAYEEEMTKYIKEANYVID